MYEPREDSLLLLKSVKTYAFGDVLEIGTGSGILAYEASKLNNVNSVTAVDIDNKALNYIKNKYKNIKKIQIIKSDLFQNVSGKFHTIIFNPPYLPQDQGIKDKAIYGGEKGYEIIEIFLKDVRAHLEAKGYILLLFSSLTNKKKIEEMIVKNKFTFKEIDKLKLDFEELYVYMIQ